MANNGKDDAKRSKYSDALRVSALAEYDVTRQLRKTATAFGIPPSTLSDWIKEREAGTLDVVDLESRIAQTKKTLIDKSITIMDKALNVIDMKINACSAPQAATVYGILHDKVQAMQGASQDGTGNVTNNFLINGVSEDEASKIMAKVLDRMKGKDIIESTAETEEDTI